MVEVASSKDIKYLQEQIDRLSDRINMLVDKLATKKEYVFSNNKKFDNLDEANEYSQEICYIKNSGSGIGINPKYEIWPV